MPNSFIIIREVCFESILHPLGFIKGHQPSAIANLDSFRFISVSTCIRFSFAFDLDKLNDWNYNKCESRQVLHLHSFLLWLWEKFRYEACKLKLLSQMNRKLCFFSWAARQVLWEYAKLFVSFFSRKFAEGILLIREVLLSKSFVYSFSALIFSPAVIRCKFHLSSQFARLRCSRCGINALISMQLAATNT